MAAMGEGVHESATSCRMGKVESVGTVEVVCVGRLLRMGCDPFLMSVWICWMWGNSMGAEWLPWEHSAENQQEGGEAETEIIIM